MITRYVDMRLTADERFFQRKILQALADTTNFHEETYLNLARLFAPYDIDKSELMLVLERLGAVAAHDLAVEGYMPPRKP